MEKLVEKLVANGYDAKIVEVEKNGIMQKGVAVNVGSDACPIYYDVDIDDYDYVVDNCEKNRERAESIIDITLDAIENVNETAYLCVRNKTDDGAVARPFLDLELYVRLDMDNATFVVTKDMLTSGKIKLTEDELFEIAKKNSIATTEIRGLGEMLGLDDADEPVKIVRCNDGIHGASVIAFLDEFIGSDVYILPSSVHEILVLPADGIEDDEVGGLVQMVRDINDGFVQDFEVLSDNVYRYSAETGEVKICEV